MRERERESTRRPWLDERRGGEWVREREHQTAMEAKQKMNVLREQNPNFGRGIYMGVCALGCCTLRLGVLFWWY